MKRVTIIGCGGAGKSTFSRILSEALNIPVYHLDQLNWKPGWVPTPADEWHHLMEDLVSKEEWIIDGNYGSTLDMRLKHADTIIFLNMPRYLCIYRIVKRRFMYYGKVRPDMGEGCSEKLDVHFFKWVWRYNKNEKPEILEKLSKLSTEKKVMILNNPGEVDQFIYGLKNR